MVTHCVKEVLYQLLITVLVLVLYSEILCGKYYKFMYVLLASSNMLLAVYPNPFICYVSYLHFLKTGFVILHTVTIGSFP
jgi:hypothetical protein